MPVEPIFVLPTWQDELGFEPEKELNWDISYALPKISPRFFIPSLINKPQDPILSLLSSPHATNQRISAPVNALYEASTPRITTNVGDVSTIWEHATKQSPNFRCLIKSWDFPDSSVFKYDFRRSPFLSEQSAQIFAIGRHHSIGQNPSATSFTQITQDELIQSLKMLAIGLTSTLHSWESESELFILPKSSTNIVLNETDVSMTKSVVLRFTKIGTGLRRLEILVGSLRLRRESCPAAYAFAHTISDVSIFLSQSIMQTLSEGNNEDRGEPRFLNNLWFKCEPFERLLDALLALCGRETTKSPGSYTFLDYDAVPLLSRIYRHVDLHYERSESHLVVATFAYILTAASKSYLLQLCRDVRFGSDLDVLIPPNNNGESKEEGLVAPEIEEEYPDFFPFELKNGLLVARRSLALLHSMNEDADYPETQEINQISWFWTHDEVEEAQKGTIDSRPACLLPQTTVGWSSSVQYPIDLKSFILFDAEPGTRAHSSVGSSFATFPVDTVGNFVRKFPRTLPDSTPTLSHLTELILRPVLNHTTTVSSTLLAPFLDTSSPLCIRDHLVLLRSHMLLTSHVFKSRLSSALFSDGEPSDIDGRDVFSTKSSQHPWTIGLSPPLATQEFWPLSGSELSFLLRTVLVDSLVDVRGSRQGNSRVVEEAEARLGFAVRDLPTGPGHDNWLNPNLIEAFDFLYMSYKPPHLVNVIITSDILSKYQRIFTFLLRLLRVQNAMGSLFRLTRPNLGLVFKVIKNTSSNQTLLHFRFLSQLFVSCLSGYVFDVAIGSQFDSMLSRIADERHPASVDKVEERFKDVFALEEYHSLVLDNILCACLLRSGQRSVGDVLRGTLEIVLAFCVLVSDLKRWKIEEHEAARLLNGLYEGFRARMTALIRSLKKVVEVETSNNSGGIGALKCLLLRLEVGDWWST